MAAGKKVLHDDGARRGLFIGFTGNLTVWCGAWNVELVDHGCQPDGPNTVVMVTGRPLGPSSMSCRRTLRVESDSATGRTGRVAVPVL